MKKIAVKWGFQSLNHNRQKCKMFPNNNHVMRPDGFALPSENCIYASPLVGLGGTTSFHLYNPSFSPGTKRWGPFRWFFVFFWVFTGGRKP